MGFKYELQENVSDSLDKAGTIIAGAANKALREIGKTYVPALKAETPKVTGKLKNSSIFQLVGGNSSQAVEVRQGARTSSGDFYGKFVRNGTKPHEIRPINKGGVLVFKIGGKTIFAKKVNHPGNKPNPYHEKAYAKVSGRIDEIIASTGQKIATDLMG